MTPLGIFALLVVAALHADDSMRAAVARARAAREARVLELLRAADPVARRMAEVGRRFLDAYAAIGSAMIPALIGVGRTISAMHARLEEAGVFEEVRRQRHLEAPPCYCGWRPADLTEHRHVARMAAGDTRCPV